MNIITFVSKEWQDYNLLVRKMTVLIEDTALNYPEDKNIVFIHTAQNVGENMITEWLGKIKSFMKQKGYTVDEKVVYYKKYTDMDIINRGADQAIIFSTKGCQRTTKCANILSISNIPTTIVRG
jgi:hypothetical protein